MRFRVILVLLAGSAAGQSQTGTHQSLYSGRISSRTFSTTCPTDKDQSPLGFEYRLRGMETALAISGPDLPRAVFPGSHPSRVSEIVARAIEILKNH